MNSRSLAWLGPMALGATVMYFLDPDRGAGRRALLRDRVRGMLDRSPADDRAIEARVRAELGRTSSHPGAIETFSTHGCVTLSGPILASEHGLLMRAVSRVRGVHEVIDELEIHQGSAGVPALQGGRLRPGQRWARASWSH